MVDDVWLMFENAWIYNRKTSRVYKYCTKVSGGFWLLTTEMHCNHSTHYISAF